MEHALTRYFAELARFDSTRALERSAVYRRLESEVERVLASLASGEHAAPGPPREQAAPPASVRATAWNVERGSRLQEIVGALAGHPSLAASDVLLLTELDHGMARSGNQFVASEIALKLRLNYVFAPAYLSLVKGAGFESRAEGEDTKQDTDASGKQRDRKAS